MLMQVNKQRKDHGLSLLLGNSVYLLMTNKAKDSSSARQFSVSQREVVDDPPVHSRAVIWGSGGLFTTYNQ
jgi:hypothetical protein